MAHLTYAICLNISPSILKCMPRNKPSNKRRTALISPQVQAISSRQYIEVVSNHEDDTHRADNNREKENKLLPIG
jgi:hypothetical protein